MKKILFLLLVSSGVYAQTDFTQYVDPFVGTGGHGHTFPGPTMPFGMVQLGPDTRLDTWDGCSGYYFSDSIIYGFSHTHISGTGVLDYGDIMLMPTTGTPKFTSKEYGSSFSKLSERAQAGYYSVLLNNGKIKVELAVTARTGLQKYTFPESANSNVILELNHRDSLTFGEINITGDNEISGLRLSHRWADSQFVYYVIQFSKPFKKFGIVNREGLTEGLRSATGHVLKAYVSFNTKEGEVIYARIGISAVSVEGARKNLQAEQPGWDFDKLVKDAKAAWNKELGKIDLQSNYPTVLRTFYSSFYHCMMAPNLYQDVDGGYRGRDLQVHNTKEFTYYTVFSLWDTYRAEHPLLTLIDKKRSSDFVNTFITEYEQGGRLPVWELSSNETDCMIGYHSVPVITEAYMKGVTGFDANEALEAMKHSAMRDTLGLPDIKKYGYIGCNDDWESVSKTLEYSYDDWCIAVFAKKLGKTEDYNYFIKRAQNYKNLYDAQTGFMRPKQDNVFLSPFDPTEVSRNYTEGNAWQYSFYVPQDLTGLIKLMNGKEKLAAKLDSLFTTSSVMHGIQDGDVTGMIGQYAHGNEPSHQIAYEYDYAGQPWKTQAMVRRIDNELYQPQPDGICGNEDCGQMSACYVIRALGFYSVCPGGDQYAIGSPLGDKAIVHLENGKTFTVIAKNNKKGNVYIQSAKLNGISYAKSYLTYEDIEKGGVLEFEMGAMPNKAWGSGESDVPVTKIN